MFQIKGATIFYYRPVMKITWFKQLFFDFMHFSKTERWQFSTKNAITSYLCIFGIIFL